MTKIKSLYLLIGVFLYLFIGQTVNAASPSLSIDPPVTALNIIPPAVATIPLSIQNKDESEITLRIQLKPFKANGENGELEYSNDVLEIFKNIQILDTGMPVETITLGPKQSKKINLSINVPQDVALIDYYFSVIFISTDMPTINSTSSINRIGIASNVLLSIGSLNPPKAVLTEFSTKTFFNSGPVPFTVRIRNLDTHFIRPKGEIIIKNLFGQAIGKINLTSTNILSDSIRAIPNDVYMQELRSRDNLSKKTENSYDFKYPIALWKENFLLGSYTATLNISMSNQGPIITKSIYFLAFPIQAIAISIAIIIAITIIALRIRKYTKKNRTSI